MNIRFESTPPGFESPPIALGVLMPGKEVIRDSLLRDTISLEFSSTGSGLGQVPLVSVERRLQPPKQPLDNGRAIHPNHLPPA